MSERLKTNSIKNQSSRRIFIKNLSLVSIASTGVLGFLKQCTSKNESYDEIQIDDIIQNAFRLTDQKSLLNLEFYFINCQRIGNKITARYQQHENYMIVRLPQQHIAEESFDTSTIINPPKAFTFISGYSYLVFRILFPIDNIFSFDQETESRLFSHEDGKKTEIDLTPESLLDWKNERKFRLVVRQDLTEPIFDLLKPEIFNNSDSATIASSDSLHRLRDSTYKDNDTSLAIQLKIDSIKKEIDSDLQNHYPFQNTKKVVKNPLTTQNDSFDIQLVPKVYGDPVTAIELPWRLIISPKLPDSSTYKFEWKIPSTDITTEEEKEKKNNIKKHKLWTASLSIRERTDEEYLKRKIAAQSNDTTNKQASTGSIKDIISQLELMILGSPDYQEFNEKYDNILPKSGHRTDLVALYIKLKVLARTEKLTFSPIGATSIIHLKNQDFEKAIKLGIGLIEWNQIISLGRDEKVEVSTLFLEAEFGHKMAFIEVAERKLAKGYYPLVRKAFIIPLDITKDYTNHITQKDEDTINNIYQKPVTRFNTPFKKITFLEIKAKEYEPGPTGTYKPSELNQTNTSFEFEAIDWHDNVVRFSKNINAFPFGAALKKTLGTGKPQVSATLQDILAPSDSSIYKSKFYKSISQDTIPFLSVNELNAYFKNDTSYINKKIESIEIKLKEVKDSTKEFTVLKNKLSFDTAFLNKVYKIENAPTTDVIDQYLNTFFSAYIDYLKSCIAKLSLIKDNIQAISDYVENLNEYSIKAFFFENYIYPKRNIIDKIKKLHVKIKNKTQNEISDVELNVKIDTLLQNSYASVSTSQLSNYKNGIQNIIDYKEIIITGNVTNQWNYIFTEDTFGIKDLLRDWIFIENIIVDNFKKYLSKDQNAEIEFIESIQIEFPEMYKVINDFMVINTKLEIDPNSIIQNIKKRIKIINDVEKLSKEIPGIILLQKQKIGFAIKEKFDSVRNKLNDNLAVATGEVKKSLSELETEFIIFKGGLKKAENKTFDFFHEYAIIPQLHQAKVYVSALNKLVQEELPISIDYAVDYLENQIRDGEFEIKQNAAMVFAKVKDTSRELVRGAIQKIGDKMPGLNVELPVHYLTYARNPVQIKDETINLLNKELDFAKNQINDEFKNQIAKHSRDLVFISDEMKSAVKVVEDLRNADPKKYFKDLGAKLFGSIGLEDILDIGFDIPRISQLPDKLLYQVSTDKFKNFSAGFVAFKPNVKSGNPTRLELFISKSIKNIQEYYAYTQLNNFSIGVIVGGTEVVTITFEQFKISSSPNQPKKTDVSIKEVKLGGPLEFIADLAKRFMAPGNGMRIQPGPRNLQVDYAIALPNISAPAFNFRNLQMVIGVNIPYDPSTLKAISFVFGVNRPEDKFLVSAGIYGGRGHFMLRATPKGIEQIDVAIEMGAYASIDLGIGRGEVFLFFGFWFITGTDNGENYIKAVAYVICSGSATVLGFITIGVSVLISLTYIKRNETALFFGEAVVTYSVKIAFFKKEFSIRYYKEIVGSSKGNDTNSLQTGAILLGIGLGNLHGSFGEDKDRINFSDVYEDLDAFEDYLNCFK